MGYYSLFVKHYWIEKNRKKDKGNRKQWDGGKDNFSPSLAKEEDP